MIKAIRYDSLPLYTDISKFLLETCLSANLTQIQVAASLNVSARTLKNREHGRSLPARLSDLRSCDFCGTATLRSNGHTGVLLLTSHCYLASYLLLVSASALTDVIAIPGNGSVFDALSEFIREEKAIAFAGAGSLRSALPIVGKALARSGPNRSR
jgi:transcriptional regulator with XRE-family HTH domain